MLRYLWVTFYVSSFRKKSWRRRDEDTRVAYSWILYYVGTRRAPGNKIINIDDTYISTGDSVWLVIIASNSFQDFQ